MYLLDTKNISMTFLFSDLNTRFETQEGNQITRMKNIEYDSLLLFCMGGGFVLHRMLII